MLVAIFLTQDLCFMKAYIFLLVVIQRHRKDVRKCRVDIFTKHVQLVHQCVLDTCCASASWVPRAHETHTRPTGRDAYVYPYHAEVAGGP